MRKRRVYIAAPYTNGDVAVNVRRAIVAGNMLMDHGFAPFVPHLSHFQHLFEPQHYTTWLALDEEWLLVCDAVYRLGGASPGADQECALARASGIPVFDKFSELTAWQLRMRK